MDTVIRSIEKYPRYFVSADGRVFHQLLPELKPGGYMRIKLYHMPYKFKTIMLHRLVAAAWIGPAPTGRHDVDHLDGVRSHNNVTNLEWVTHAENMARARLRGDASKAGEKNPHAKLTEKQVLKIRSRLKAGVPNKTIAAEYHLSSGLVSMIRTRKIWTHI
jgi:hypothetical protein